MPQTLDQQRARFAWKRVNQAHGDLGKDYESYKNLAKGAPALIMANGLMPALAFYKSRAKDPASALLNDMLAWLVCRFKDHPSFAPMPTTFEATMDRLFRGDSALYMRATDETLSMLKWLRQFADALK